MDKVTKEQVEEAKTLLRRALAEGYDPRAMGAFRDTRLRPPVWKILIPDPDVKHVVRNERGAVKSKTFEALQAMTEEPR